MVLGAHDAAHALAGGVQLARALDDEDEDEDENGSLLPVLGARRPPLFSAPAPVRCTWLTR